ncbi:hypothetical protein IQ07DRAFT_607424 [Pyrenochaeta sp. DS3sAY3a]|nr:hypothetical protein IQ07DRAFT_607424 [Pyrenochaeta sp. DS3sAY3a]
MQGPIISLSTSRSIAQYSSKRTYNKAVFNQLHALLPLSTTSQQLNLATRNIAAVSPTRRLTRDRSPPKKDVIVATQQKEQQGPLEEADADANADAKQSVANAFSKGAPSFPTPTSSLRSLSLPKKKTASTKADLAYLNPNIKFLLLRNIKEINISLPKSKRQLNLLITNPPISIVVGPILYLLQRIKSFKKSAVSNARIAVLDVTPTKISLAKLVLFSKDLALYCDLDKRIDYIIGLNLHRTTLKTLRRTKYYTTAPSINQTASFANKTPIFLNIKDLGFLVFAVKINSNNWLLRVTATRVMLHTSAAAKCPRNEEENAQEIETEEGLIPLLEDKYKLFFFRPLALGNTLTLKGLKRLLTNLINITR